jgi:hypothetical protein
MQAPDDLGIAKKLILKINQIIACEIYKLYNNLYRIVG